MVSKQSSKHKKTSTTKITNNILRKITENIAFIKQGQKIKVTLYEIRSAMNWTKKGK